MCSIHSTTAESDAELCDEVSQDHSWRIFAREEQEYSRPQVGQVAKGIFCTHEEETPLFGHLECMKDERVLKKLLVCAPEHGTTNCRRPASQMERCSDKGPQALWFKRRSEREGS